MSYFKKNNATMPFDRPVPYFIQNIKVCKKFVRLLFSIKPRNLTVKSVKMRKNMEVGEAQKALFQFG